MYSLLYLCTAREEDGADELKARTGGATLEVRVAEAADVGRAAALLGGVTGTQPRTDSDARLVSVPVGEGTTLLLEAGRRLQDAGIALNDLGIRRPTLDEVFLSLTGVPVLAGTAQAGSPRSETPATTAAREAAR